MSTCATVNRPILVNITNMEDQSAKETVEKASDGIEDGVHDAKGVKEVSTPAASSLLSSRQVSRSSGENADTKARHNGKNWPKSLIRRCGKFESGSGSGDQDGGTQEDGLDIVTKKRKTRRGKPKHKKLKPYPKQQLSYQQRARCRSIGRLAKTGRQIRAPYNTTQFLMDDHSDLPDLDQKLSIAASSDFGVTTFQKPPAPSRTRDSSFSIDSDEDYFYSSPEDEEEFLTKEFSSAYEDLHAERLSTLSKSELIQEYLQLEAKVDLLTKRLRGKNISQTEDKEIDNKNGLTTESEVAKKLKICQQHIDDLLKQNEQLKRENEALRAQRHGSSVSSVDSESDSDSTSNGNRSICSCPFRNTEYSPEHVSCKCRQENSDKDSSSECSTDSKSDCSDITRSTTSTPPIIVTNGHVVINEINGLPT
ncbi:protein HEXIM1-like [Vespula maculifrons]|uniref:Protein HEXIM1 n=3 Tax=Vespula TaxID=7451 RepID=A0A834N9R0_VESVU|nr:hypothetical protein HZH66_006214 [Vespula vulgaris]